MKLKGFVTRVTLQVLYKEQELFTLPEHLSSPPGFSLVGVAQSLVFCLMYCRSLFVLLSFFFFWPLYCLSFFELYMVSDYHFSVFKRFLLGEEGHVCQLNLHLPMQSVPIAANLVGLDSRSWRAVFDSI